jgi:hypothetical protein
MALGAFSGTRQRSAEGLAGRSVAVALCLLAAFALSACNTRRHQAIPVASAADLPTAAAKADATPGGEPVVTAAATGALPVAETVDTAVVTGDEVATEADIALAVDSFEAAEPADPDEVMGLGRNAVQALLGKPGLVRREAPAEVWQYQSRGCVLDVFLYEASADFQVVYLEARTGQALSAATATCLGAVLDRRRATPSS